MVGRISVELEVPVAMRDGTILRANMWRPCGEGPWPVLLGRHPYDKNVNLGSHGAMDPVKAATRGYLVIVQDVRGRFASDGEWAPLQYELEDGFDTVQWAAALPDCDGSVVMFGQSYWGFTQWAAAMTRPPALRAIAPMFTWADPLDGLLARDGASEYGLDVHWSLANALEILERRHDRDTRERVIDDLTELAERTYWELPAAHRAVLARHDLPDIGYRRFLADPASIDRSTVAIVEAIVPSLNIGGWHDVFLQGTIDNYIGARAASRLIIGPWAHDARGAESARVGDRYYGPGAAVDSIGFRGGYHDFLLDWYDQMLRRAKPVPDNPVTIFVMGLDEWRDEAGWPLARAVDAPLYLHDGGRLDWAESSGGTDCYAYNPADPVRTNGGPHLLPLDYDRGQADQCRTEARADVLVYTGAPLEHDLEVTGQVRAWIFAATDAPSTDWVVRLCDVDANGVSLSVCDGVVRVEPSDGEVHGYQVDLWSTSIVFRAGHRIRVQVTSSNFPRWDRNLNTGDQSGTTWRVAQQQIVHDTQHPSHVIVPTVPTTTGG